MQCREWRENLRRIANESESSKSEDVGKLLMELTIASNADPIAGKQQAVQLVEPKSSKGKGLLATGSGSGSGSVTGSTASRQKIKQQVDSASNKSKVRAKLIEELVMGSVSSSGSGSGQSTRQLRMKRRVAERSRKNINQIQTKKKWNEYTDRDKKIICAVTFLIVYALFLKK